MKLVYIFAVVAGLAACAHTASSAAQVQVYRSDGSRQCEQDSGSDTETMQALLEGAGIRVYAARKGHLRDMAVPDVCGGATGSVNVYTIDAAQTAQAQAQGFALWRDE